MNKYELYCGNIISFSEEIDPNNNDQIEELKSRLRFRFLKFLNNCKFYQMVRYESNIKINSFHEYQ